MATAATATANSPFDRLSGGLLQQVLQGVPQSERLTQCSLVSRAWAEAAVLATTDVVWTPLDTKHVSRWLEKHAGSVRSFVARGMVQALELPWPLLKQLQVLSIERFKLPPVDQTGSTGGGGGGGASSIGSTTLTTRAPAPAPAAAPAAPLLPALKQLELRDCTLHSSGCLRQLASSPQLTSFKVDCDEYMFRQIAAQNLGGSWASLSSHSRQQVSTELCSILQQMQQLVVLHLRGLPVSPKAFQHVAAMKHLQDLQVSVCDTPGDSGATHDLPTSLTRLYVWDQRQQKTQLLTNLQPLTSLQELELQSCELSVSTAALGSMMQLQALHLASCTLLPDHRQGYAALLSALQQLTCLQSLRLDDIHVFAVPLFSALTASSQLTALCVAAQNEQPLAQGAVQHAFPAGRQLPQMKVLKIVLELHGHGLNEQQGWCVDSDDLAAIISACPHLEQLHVRDVMPRGADIAPLLRLPPSCKVMAVGGDAFNDDAAAVVAQLTQLTYLWWDSGASLTDTTLLGLTTLRDLHNLYMFNLSSISREVRLEVMRLQVAGYVFEEGEEEFELQLGTTENQGRVWEQLVDICDHSPACWRVRMQHQNAAHQAQIAQLQQQLADRDARLAERDAQLADRDAQVAQLQQELAELRAV